MRRENDRRNICIISAYTYVVNHINYGSILQYYALQTALKAEGYSAYWLRFVIRERKSLVRGFRNILKICIYPQNELKSKRIMKDFKRFIDRYLNVSEEVYNDENTLKINCPKADAYITGSDQVWGGVEEANYLTFVPEDRKKISYAASFGKGKISDEHFRTVEPWVKKIHYVSVREKSGLDICSQMGVQAKLVLDPTLLIDSGKYPSVVSNSMKGENYIFGYFLNLKQKTDLPLDKIREYVNNNATKLIVAGGVHGVNKVFKQKELDYLSPEKWLGRYSQAQAIITNTFHGTVFAIIYHKPFIVFLQKGSTAAQNERLMSLLEYFELKERIYQNDNSLQEQMNEKINWNRVDLIRRNGTQESLEFIRHAMLY